MSRRAFTVAVVAATIAWSIGLAALVTPLTANAAASGDLVRGSLPAVYYVGADGKRYVFPNEKTYTTWYGDFSTVQVVTDAELAAMPIGGNVTYKPGNRMIKIQTDPKVYAVGKDGTLRWVKDEATATCLYGASWNTMIDDVSDAFFVNYTIGADINACGDFDKAAASAGSPTINADKDLSVGPGSLSVGASSMMPVGGTLPQGATAVNMLKFDVRNGGSSTAIIDSITVRRIGPGDVGDFDFIYVYRGNDRLTSGRTINGSTNESTFSALGLSIAAGATESLWIAADADGAAGNVDALQVVGVTSGSTVATGTPVTGPYFTFANVAVGEVTIDEGGAIATVKAGETGVKVAEFDLTADGEDASFQRIALEFTGTANNSDVSNFVLKRGSTTLATVTGVNADDMVVFALTSPFMLENGTTRTFEVYADIAAGVDTADDIKFDLDQDSDLLCVGQSYGYGMTVNDTMSEVAVNIEAGQLTAVNNGPATRDIAAGGNDVELLNITLSAQANLEYRTLRVRINIGGGDDVADVIEDLKVVDAATGVIISDSLDGTDGDAQQDFEFNDSFYIASGASRTVKVTADIEDGSEGNTVQAIWGDAVNDDLFEEGDVRNLDNGDDLDPALDAVPGAPLAGNAHDIVDAGLTVAVGSTPVAQTYIQGGTGVALMGFGLTANEASDLLVESITVTGWTFGDTPVRNLLLTGSLWNGSVMVGSYETPSAADATQPGHDGEMVFDNLNLSIPAGESVALLLKGDLRTSLAAGEDMWFSIEAGDIDVEDADNEPLAAGQIDGLAIDGPDMAIELEGNLTVVLAPEDADTEAGIVVGGTSNAVLAKYKLTAQFEDLKLTRAMFEIGDAASASSVSLWSGSTLVGGPVGVTGAGIAQFTGLNVVIPKDSHNTLTVKANLNSVGGTGAATGSLATVTLLDNDFEVRGISAGSNTLIDDGDLDLDIVGYTKVIHKSKPSVALVSLPTSQLTAGDVTASRFTVSADAAGEVAVMGLVFEIQNQTNGVVDPVGSESSVRRIGGSYINGVVTVTDDTDNDGSCENGETCFFAVVFDQEEVISAGSQVTYSLMIDVDQANTGTDSLSVKLLGDDFDANVDDYADFVGYMESDVADGYSIEIDDATDARFVWSDVSLLGHNDLIDDVDGSIDWMTGAFVRVLPTDSQTMSN
ncbi:MAG: hypothetical protein V1738_01235 [Patescibacteria group bacterium]